MAILANELRVGNLYYPKGTNYAAVVNANDIGAIQNGIGVDFYQPIPLTPEILEKCGFDWSIYHQAFRQHQDTVEFYYLNECYPSGFQFSTFKKQQLIGNPIQYLHQLQNLYFALTGEELTFKP